LSATGALGERSLKDVWRALDRSAGAVSNVRALMAAYRRAVMDIERVMSESTGARQIRGTRRAMTYIREHLGEPLSLDKVSRMAGFAPSYFSKLVKREEGVPFEQYARQLRLERAKQMLSGTSFGVAQVAQQCGFGTRNYFHEAFKRAEGMGPSQYRNKVRLERAQELLGVTTETIERVAEISGLGGVEQLERVFKRSLGMTPLEYRQRWRKSRPRRKSV
jgi:two-component system response regulator YesN